MKTLLNKESLVFEPPELGCVLYLPGLPCGGSTIFDRSPYGNNGAITGATWVRLPSGLWVLSFDGSDDYVDCGTGVGLDITTAITVELWISLTTATGEQYALEKSNDKWFVYFPSDGDAPRFRIALSGGTISESFGSLTVGTFYHLVGTYDSAGGTAGYNIYNNASLVTTVAANGTIQTSTGNLYLGSRAGTYPTEARIGSCRIYNYALTPFEIQNHFEREKHLFGVW